jgi:nucleotide-binding universal stress UspA family protein
MKYLLATDGSEPSLQAVRFLLQQSRSDPENEFFVTYVFPLPPDPECYEGILSLPLYADDERVAEVARPILNRTLEILGNVAGRVNQVTLVGNPARDIVEFAMNLGVDLIVTGTRGRSPEQEAYLGSVSSALTHRARCSVLIVK